MAEGGPSCRGPRWAGRGRSVVTAVVAVVALVGCTNGDRLAVLRDEAILGPPEGAVELARTESGGRSVGFGTPARVEVVWGVDDAAAAGQAQVDRYGVDYDLQENTAGEWLGTRPDGDEAVNVSVRAWDGLSAVRWDTMTTEEADVDPWPGEVLVVRASSP